MRENYFPNAGKSTKRSRVSAGTSFELCSFRNLGPEMSSESYLSHLHTTPHSVQ